MKRKLILLFCLVLGLYSCRKNPVKNEVQEDTNAKKMLQGVWISEDDEEIAFRVKGDTIYYPDSTSRPCYFVIRRDTLIMHGTHDVKYYIVKQAPHIFQFKNQTGDLVKLVKSTDPNDVKAFNVDQPVAINQFNQGQLIKRDTVVHIHGQQYHSYVQVNPTSYKVYKSYVNDDGVEVDNIYYDNIIHISLFHGASCVFSRDFHKMDFRGRVREDVLSQSILSDILFMEISSDGAHYTAQLCIPDSPSVYEVQLIIGFDGKLTMRSSR
ncbi:DUF4738 domain-containing protein [Segatella bryantii]|uniref:DUF4738 domain-containing protein n=1 Tax=Segatella bryantii TaxID=77095 RepID=UPI00242B6AAF|nr:DUF4738 domain-containing protein [Segatella bryantii]